MGAGLDLDLLGQEVLAVPRPGAGVEQRAAAERLAGQLCPRAAEGLAYIRRVLAVDRETLLHLLQCGACWRWASEALRKAVDEEEPPRDVEEQGSWVVGAGCGSLGGTPNERAE